MDWKVAREVAKPVKSIAVVQVRGDGGMWITVAAVER